MCAKLHNTCACELSVLDQLARSRCGAIIFVVGDELVRDLQGFHEDFKQEEEFLTKNKKPVGIVIMGSW